MRFTAIPLVLLTGALLAGLATSSSGADGPSIFDDTRPPAQHGSTTHKSADPKATKPTAENQTAPAIPTTPAKASIPDAASLTAAERLIQDLLGNDLKSPSTEVRRQAAVKLLSQIDSSASVPEQFAMLRRARQVAASAGDAVTAFAAVRQTAARFFVDERALRAETILALTKSVRELFDVETTINQALAAMDDAVGADDYPAAIAIAAEVKPLADRLKTSDTAADFAVEAKRVRELAGEYPSVKQAQAKLRTAPDDAAASALVGRFFCLRKYDWPKGLPFLAQGNDPKLRTLAAAETTAAVARAKGTATDPDATEALKVGDAWWDDALSQPGVIKLVVQAHAGDWYRTALPGVTGIRKLQVQERLAAAYRAQTQIAAQARRRWVILMRSDDPSVWTRPAGASTDRSGFAADVESAAPPDTAFLRLRRMDTGEFVIIPLKKEELHKQTPTWCGTAWVGYGGTHLGIKHANSRRLENGLVDIDANYQGWGFGHVIYAPEAAARGYAWATATIAKTVFEIAVTSDELNPLERRALIEVK